MKLPEIYQYHYRFQRLYQAFVAFKEGLVYPNMLMAVVAAGLLPLHFVERALNL